MAYPVNEPDDHRKIPPSDPRRKKLLTKLTNKHIADVPTSVVEDFRQKYNNIINPYITKIYVDMSLLQDMYLGAILHKYADDEKIYQLILNSLDRYSNRLINVYSRYFPDLDITDEELREYVSDPTHALNVLMASPSTDMWVTLRKNHHDVIMENRSTSMIMDVQESVMEYVVNIYPVQPVKELSELLKAKFILGIRDPDIKFGVISQPSHQLNPNLYEYFQHWYVDDITTWMNDETCTAYKALVDMKLKQSSIWSRPLVNTEEIANKLSNMNDSGRSTFARSLHEVYNRFTIFDFIKTKILSR